MALYAPAHDSHEARWSSTPARAAWAGVQLPAGRRRVGKFIGEQVGEELVDLFARESSGRSDFGVRASRRGGDATRCGRARWPVLHAGRGDAAIALVLIVDERTASLVDLGHLLAGAMQLGLE